MAAPFTLIVKTLKKEEFTFTVTRDDTILSLKQQIEQKLNHDVASQKLIFTGKILTDTQTIGSAEIGEGNFLVLLPSARKSAAPTKPPASTPSPTSTTPSPSPTPATPTSTSTSTPPTPTPTTTTPTPTATVPSTTTTPSSTPTPSTTSAVSVSELENDLATGSDYEAKVQELVDMGFERGQVVIAMEAAFNNVSRAADYLLNGIPSSVRSLRTRTPSSPTSPGGPPPPPPVGGGLPASPSPPVGGGLPASPSPPGSGGSADSLWDAATQAQSETAGGGSGALDFLRNLPYFNQLRMAVQSNPNMLPLILQQLAQTQPQVLQLIQAHQQEFIELLSEPVSLDGMGGGLGGLGGSPGGPQVVSISLTPPEHEAVQRLIALGFDSNRVLQAFIACDKNENDAANFLFEHAAEDDDASGMGGLGDDVGGGGGLEDDEDFFE